MTCVANRYVPTWCMISVHKFSKSQMTQRPTSNMCRHFSSTFTRMNIELPNVSVIQVFMPHYVMRAMTTYHLVYELYLV